MKYISAEGAEAVKEGAKELGQSVAETAGEAKEAAGLKKFFSTVLHCKRIICFLTLLYTTALQSFSTALLCNLP